mgnify:CR=1 FL=1
MHSDRAGADRLPQHRHQSAGAFQRGYKGHAGRDPARPQWHPDCAGGRDDRRPSHPHDSRTGSAFGLADGDRVQVKIDGPKPGVMGGVLIRANDKCALDFHIDTDDGNAFLLKQGLLVTVLGKEE